MRVQGLSFGVRRLVAAFARRDSSRRTFVPVTSHRRQKAGASSRTPKTTPPVRPPALDGQAKAAPDTGPHDEQGSADLCLRSAAIRCYAGKNRGPTRQVRATRPEIIPIARQRPTRTIRFGQERKNGPQGRDSAISTAPAIQAGCFSGPAWVAQDSMKSSISLREATTRG